MPVPVGRGEVQALIAQGALVLDVLDATEFTEAHLPGARNIPAAGLIPERLTAVDSAHPVVVYSRDLQCDLSPRAARLLECYGFGRVFDYEAGKADWLAFGLPHEGDGTLLASDLLEPCVCARGDDTVADVRERMDSAGAEHAVVVDDGDIVLGSLMRFALADAPPGAAVRTLMVPSPVTVRPAVTAAELGRRLAGDAVGDALVTTSSGRLLGRVSRSRLDGDSDRHLGPRPARAAGEYAGAVGRS